MNEQYGGRSAAGRSQCMLVRRVRFEDVWFFLTLAGGAARVYHTERA